MLTAGAIDFVHYWLHKYSISKGSELVVCEA